MSGKDQETEAELARIRAEWTRLEAERERLEVEAGLWRDELLAKADELGMGERVRGIRQAGKSQKKGQSKR